ncbi:hypothetical protein M404DRAFT_924311 [Pisolithus tinctorius Marx 270]|uniref:Uncharacterized protein n=1 Tax=Pisolithus tinctorius Marx 270 TaxID=870435 RepID=A0A0C3IIY2_PISTI|nr:hypothetical protein M404DRAFT_924311 [Pisolithus tinctorius Marx 270]
MARQLLRRRGRYTSWLHQTSWFHRRFHNVTTTTGAPVHAVSFTINNAIEHPWTEIRNVRRSEFVVVDTSYRGKSHR